MTIRKTQPRFPMTVYTAYYVQVLPLTSADSRATHTLALGPTLTTLCVLCKSLNLSKPLTRI